MSDLLPLLFGADEDTYSDFRYFYDRFQ